MTEPPWLNAREMDAWLAYLTASHLLERRIEEQLKADSGLTHSQYEILTRLSSAPGQRMRMTELARLVVVSKSGLTYQVGQLEKIGLVERVSCPSDERGVMAVLTGEGLRCLEKTAPGHLAVVRAFLIDHFGPDELTSMTRIMWKVASAMGAAVPPSGTSVGPGEG
ncbi:MarR family winged helix-turn-helix transcriptional regulator [Microtetraspora malaysiensis]|uniref:MarR family winged helix-turn-helix transcriptional regulator n=1 Tax=Microtetraspora malaysiensis TaxID=161358 RepID=UPI003D900635